MFESVVNTMRTFSNLKGLHVYDLETGKVLGVVEDLCFTHEGEINGIVVDVHGLLKRDKIIPMESITSIGKDGIMIEKNPTVIRTKTKQDCKLHDPNQGVIGKPLLTSEGNKLGHVEDVYFQEELGTIVGYEVTDGFFADMTEGRKVIQTNSPAIIGKEVIVVDI